MISFYSVLILLCLLALGVLCVLVSENSLIPKEDKRRFYLTYGVIALSALAEWGGIQLNGNPDLPKWLLAAVKCADYILTPLAGGSVVAQMKLRNGWYKALMGVLAGNTVFQIISCFNNWMVVIDENNHYSHGSLYAVYISIYLFVIFLTAAEFRVYGLTYHRQNRASLYSVFLFVIAGIALQEFFGGEYRTAYVAITLGVALMFIYYSEFYHMQADDRIKTQRKQLMHDALSGVFSRHAYMKALEKFNNPEKVPENAAVFSIDINGLKAVNDNTGHDAGDKLIIAAARCIEKVFGNKGICYRTGGDEFVVLAKMEKEQAEKILLELEKESKNRTAGKDIKLSLSAGYALSKDYQGFTTEELVKKADQAMYAAKAEYYRINGYDRRVVFV